ncbi:hypothetical protein E1B28_001751 [Marasmius oreades]|uniref:F-box domain-containing protein n=1 Tax=Marasmius oreades TaxID=181124 RepID=A0A9P8AFV8_9AGAR|nr:uncharacterized protein E1B28_001751 [Marasmius oreades]KAG7099958.1 hypothetical protein E1B28_001751 [Marasmius oreades]
MDSNPQEVIAVSVNTLQDFDEKLKTITEELKRVQYERNLHVPICRLPAEILGSIFTFHTECWNRAERRSPRRSSRYWINILLVCRLWCMIAYSTPSMWSTPDFMFPKTARRLLKYSKSSPLNIRWDFIPAPLSTDHIEAFTEAVSRPACIASLDLHAISNITRNFLVGVLKDMNEPAPLIRSIRIVADETTSIVLPRDFLGGEAVRLTDLDLVGCSIPWETPLVGNLTRLAMKRLPLAIRPTIKDMFELLQRAPSLREIHLDSCLSPNRIPLPSDSTVGLPHLKSLSMSVGSEVCCTLLQHMSFPDTTRIHFQNHMPSIADGGFNSLFAYISGLLSPSSSSADHARAIKTLKVQVYKYHRETVVIFRAWNISCDCSEVAEFLDTPIPHLSIDLEMLDETVTEMTSKILALGPLTHLENLRFNCTEPPSPDVLIQYLGNLNRLSSVFLMEQASFQFVKTMSRNLTPKRKPRKKKAAGKKKQQEEEAAVTQSQPPLFPALKTLGFADVDFRENSHNLLKPLLTALKLREENGYPLKKVILEACIRLRANDVEKIAKRVEVDWDESENEDDDDEDDDDDDDDEDGYYDDDVFPPFFPFPFLPSFYGPNF